jgi:regulator of protease activity HflC (stomatin/prohibitin superfamily)
MRTNQVRVSRVGVALFMVCMATGLLLAGILERPWWLVPFAVAGVYLLYSIRVADQWERVAVLRFGKYRGLAGPGMFHMIPIVDVAARYVDQRVRVANVSAESTLTRDTVPVNVDAIVFWMVWNPEKAVLEVQNFDDAILMSAQTALRESIGRHELHQMVAEREMLGEELQRILDAKTNPWGITVQSVEIRDVQIPPELQDAMSREAQAAREKEARIILGQAEVEIAHLFEQASKSYEANPTALHLRAMNILYEGLKEKGALMLIPSTAVESMGLGGLLGAAALRQQALAQEPTPAAQANGPVL